MNQEENKEKHGMEQKSGISLDTAEEGMRLGCGTSKIKSREQGRLREIATPSGQEH